jgi:hypothetical protein
MALNVRYIGVQEIVKTAYICFHVLNWSNIRGFGWIWGTPRKFE